MLNFYWYYIYIFYTEQTLLCPVIMCGYCSAKHEAKVRKNKSNHHVSFTHTLNIAENDSAKRWKIKQKQRHS